MLPNVTMQMRYDYVINTVKLRASSGQLGEMDIKELNGWLNK